MSLLLKNITKRFKSDTVLDNLSLSVESGETVVLSPADSLRDGARVAAKKS